MTPYIAENILKKSTFYLVLFMLMACVTSLYSCKQKQTESALFQLLPSTQTNIHFVNNISDNDKPGNFRLPVFL